MRTIYVRELSKYSRETLSKKMQLGRTATTDLIHELVAAGVLKTSLEYPNQIEGPENCISTNSGDRSYYQFTWVGIALFQDLVLVVYPKYINKDVEFYASAAGHSEMQQILKVIRKAHMEQTPLHTIADGPVTASGYLAVMLSLIDSFAEHGLYSNYLKSYRANGNGRIDWDRTIATNMPYISNNVPVYFDYVTTSIVQDNCDYITRLHRCALTTCYTCLSDIGLADLLSIEPINLSTEQLDDFGDKSFVLYTLTQERSSQYVTWKQEVLDLLHAFISTDPISTSTNSSRLVCYGTPSFQIVWERACQTAFGNQLERPIGELGIELTGKWLGVRHKRLIDIIPRPKWTKWTQVGSISCGEVATLIPDVISIANTETGGRVFCIYDAKYYTPVLGPRTVGVPGVESITKQLLYQRAYREFVLDNSFDAVANIFLVPTDGARLVHLGTVEFPGLFDPPGNPFADGVEMWAIPSRYIYNCYLNDVTVDGAYIRQICGLS